MRKYYESSLNSELRCNASVYGPESPVERSQDTRIRTEDLLKEKKDRFLRTLAANNKSLSELDGKTDEMEHKVKHLSNKVEKNIYFGPICTLRFTFISYSTCVSFLQK